MKLLVLGANSQIGRELAALLRLQAVEHETLTLEELPLSDDVALAKLLSAREADQIINTVDCPSPREAEEDAEAARACERLARDLPAVLAEICDHLSVPLLQLSSSLVFDGLNKSAYREDDEINPQAHFGLSHWQGEQAVRERQPRHIILRSDWVFSEQRIDWFAGLLRDCKANRGKLRVMDHRFSPTPAADLARVLLAIARQVDCHVEVWGTYHYCSLQALSEAQFVEGFLREAGRYDPDIEVFLDKLELTLAPPQLPCIPNSSLNCQKIMETFGIKQRSRAPGLNRVLARVYPEAAAAPEAEQPVQHKEPESGGSRRAGGH